MDLASIFATSAAKAILIAVLIFMAHKWAKGDLDKPLKSLKKVGKEYGIVTVILLIIWWILTPSGMPDDYAMVWLVAKFGLVPYLITLGSLTIYLLWRMKVTIVIYKKR